MKGFIKLSVAVIAAAALVTSARAMTVALTAVDYNGITDVGGNVGLAQGDLVELGITSSTATQIQAAFASGGASAANALFTIWATDSIGDGTGIDSSIANPGIGLTGTGFFGSQAYMIVFNQATVGGNIGVFAGKPYAGQAGVGAGDPWTFPANDTSPTVTFDTGDVGASGVILGSIGTDNDPDSALSGSPALELAGVPEPSSIALVVVGVLGAIGLIRRRR